MKKLLILPIFFVLMLSLATAMTLDGSIQYVPSSADVIFEHYGTSISIESLNVEQDTFTFNTYGKPEITLTAENHGTDPIYFNYDTVGKTLNVNITKTDGDLIISGMTAFIGSTTFAYEIEKDGILYDYYRSEDTYMLEGDGDYIIKPTSTLDGIGNAVYGNDASVHQTEKVDWNITIKKNIALNFYEVGLRDEYDNFYETTFEDDGVNRIYSAAFNVEKNGTVDENVTYKWYFRSYEGEYIESDSFDVEVIFIDVSFVSPTPAGYSYGFISALKDEDNPNHYVYIDELELELRYWYGDNGGELYKTENYAIQPQVAANYYYWFNTLTEANTNMHYEIYFKYDNEFTQRWVDYDLVSDDANMQDEYNMYVINDSTDYTPLQITLASEITGAKQENKIVELERYYNDEGVWRIVQSSKTDASGNALFYIKEASTDYRFTFKSETGGVYRVTPQMTFYCATDLCESNFFIDESAADDGERPTLRNQITHIESTGVIENRYYIESGREMTVTTSIIKQTSSGNVEICNLETTGVTDIHTCDISAHTGLVRVYVTSTYDGETILEDTESYTLDISKLSDEVDFEDAVFWSLLLIVLIVFMVMWSPIAVIVATIASLAFVGFMGLLTGITGTFLILTGILGLIVALKVRK